MGVFDKIKHFLEQKTSKKKGLWAIIAIALVAILKFKSIFAIAISLILKLKSLLVFLKIGKFATTFISMFVMIWVYSLQFGASYAVGFVLLLALHESGHVFAARWAGLKVSMPIFIPFVGAFISLKQQPANAKVEAIIAAGGPMLGSIAAFACLGLSEFFYQEKDLFLALTYTGCLINIFNLIPVSPLDGGRIIIAISPLMWVIGIPILILVAIKYPNPILILLLILGIIQVIEYYKSSKKSYFKVSKKTRITFAIFYFGLLIILGCTMSGIHTSHSALLQK